MAISKEQLKDKLYRLNNFYKIVDQNKRLITFKLNRAQADFHAKKHTNNIILKSRQLGFSTYEAIDALDDVLWTPNFNALMISYDRSSAEGMFDDKVSLAWNNYPASLKKLYRLDADRSNKLKFDFGNLQYSSISVKTRGRSGTYNRVHISEFAKICREEPRKAKEIISGTFQAVPIGGRKDIESTAEGNFGYFYEMFWDAWLRGEPRNQSEWKAHFYNWRWDDKELDKISIPISLDEMDEKDYFKEAAIIHQLSDRELTYYYYKFLECRKDLKLLQQEYPITPEEAFVSSGNRFFPLRNIEIQEKRYLAEGERSGNWIFYEPYLNGHNYAAGVDTSEGVGKDNSAIVIWDFTYRPKIVAVFSDNKTAPDRLAYEIKFGCSKYDHCLVAVERNNHGHTTLATLKTIYPMERIYKQVVKDEEYDKEVVKLGWHTNGASKPRMMYDLRTALAEDFIEIPSKEVLSEMKTYEAEDLDQISTDYENIRHWDRTIAAAIGFQMKSKVLEMNSEIEVEHKKQSSDYDYYDIKALS